MVVLSFESEERRKARAVEFRVLGPLEVHDGAGGLVPLRARKERALLVILLLHANEFVSTDRLIDALWGEERPESAAKLIQTYVSHLRRVLEPDRKHGEYRLPVTRSSGYVLDVAPGQL